MAVQQSLGRDEIIKELRHYLKGRVSSQQMELILQFAERYYISSALEDLAERSYENLFGALLSHWQLLNPRMPHESKVRVFNPSLEKDGWQSTHTIIEISHDDIPFLVDSTRMEISRNGYQIHYAIHCGGLKVLRDEKGCIIQILPIAEVNPKATTEAPIYIEIDRIPDEEAREALRTNLLKILGDVELAVVDWRGMIDKAEESLKELEQNPPPFDEAEVNEAKDFLRWLIANHFTFLGCRDYKLIGKENSRALQVIPGTGLGVLRDDVSTPASKNYSDLPPQARKLALAKNILIIAKTNTRSTVHRDTYTDYIGVKRFNENGELIGERRFIGLYTSTAYHSSPRYIPFLRHKVAKVIQEFHYPPDSHNGKEVVHILETLPRDDLFQATNEELVELTREILHLQERKRIRLLVRKDSFGRYFSCLVYVPREIFNTDLCLSFQDILMHTFDGIESSFTTYFSDSVLARVHFLIRVNPKIPVEYDRYKIEQLLTDVSRSWNDELRADLIKEFGEAEGLRYYTTYRKSFPASYMEYYYPTSGVRDIIEIEKLSTETPLRMSFYQTGESLRLKLFHKEKSLALSDVMPTLENLGLRVFGERPHELTFKDGTTVWIADFDMIMMREKQIDVEALREKFIEAFINIWFENAEDDGLNKLVLDAGLSWHEIAILRAYTKYLRQIGFTFSQNYIEQALINNPKITITLIELFKLKFNPELSTEERSEVFNIIPKIEESLEAVFSLDEDRILRRLLEVISATLRTNYFQMTKANKHKPYLSLKFDPSRISDLPLPRPLFEIFVYSPRVEGVHLRGGKVARGGLRWSDRREDFRTEVLGLMKAQQVKNSVIVPVGAKGGFFPKQIPLDADRDTIMEEGIESYKTFICGLLDITDNIKNGEIVPPSQVVRYDEDDAYLVVAADKGTATFSDIANLISKEFDFWLGDAFASGGSAGYDHKKMGITARGAWVSVTRHFRELGINPNVSDISVVGIGDMAGDVFGNGMLMSKHIRLLAAYNHVHIFVDPNPIAEDSYKERERLFKLPRSTWMDYNPELISRGGGVFSRSAKSIKITPEMKAAFGIVVDTLVPNDLIRAILTAQVDLIWNGGIGTFVKASTETHLEVGDRTNDGIRVDGNQLRARVVGEGGNLGLTQLARVEYSLNGGVLYTDFVDNSAGVDCSDHEVNLKILFNRLIQANKMTLAERDSLLEGMTNEVADLVLKDNYEQTQIVSLEASVVMRTMDMFRLYMDELEKSGRLNRKLEFLPDEKELQERKANGQGLTRPEIAVLISYCKMYLKQDILATDIPEDLYFDRYLKLAFPASLQDKYSDVMKEHSLRREIIATQVGKSLTDHMGVNFVERLQRETGASLAFVIRSYMVASHIFNLEELWHQIEALDYKVNTEIQQRMMLQLYYLVRRSTRWILRNRKPNMNIEETIHYFTNPLVELKKALPELMATTDKEKFNSEREDYINQGVPESLANEIALCHSLFTSLDILEASLHHKLPITEVGETYYALGSQLELDWLREQMNAYLISDHWEELARSGYRDDLDRVQRKLSVSVLTVKEKKSKDNGDKKNSSRITRWTRQYQLLIDRWMGLMSEIKANGNAGFVMYSVILRELFDFAQVE